MSGHEDGEHLLVPLGNAAPGGRRRAGCLEIICGPMFSGKTEELLRRARRVTLARQKVVLFKPRVDDRYDAVKVVSHQGDRADAIPVSGVDELLARVPAEAAVVGIDEVQFFENEVARALDALAGRGFRVIAAGLDQDSSGRPFGPMPELLALADYVTKLRAVCAQCGGPASRSQRLVAREETLFVGGAAAYEARCRSCFSALALREP